jgi:hypothetical protein
MKRPKIFFPTLFVLFIITFISITIYRRSEFNRELPYLDILQDQMASTAYLISIGNSIVNNKPVPEGWSLERIKTTGLEVQYNLFDTYRWVRGSKIEDYYFSILSKLLEIDAGAKDNEAWRSRSEDPPQFAIYLNDQDLEMAISRSLNSIMELKEFSELAEMNNDKEAMRFVAARLQVQLNWLTNLEYSKDPGFFAEVMNITTVSANAIGHRRECFNVSSLCSKLPSINTQLNGVWRSTYNYSIGEPSEMSTTESWTGLETTIGETGVPLGGAGLQVADDGVTKLSPRLEDFYDNCRGLGGSIGGTGGVQTRLPTTESGHTCWYDGNSCWDMLTYSGERYKGGEGHCEEMGLVPVPNFIDNIIIDIGIIGDDINNAINDFSLDDLTDSFSDTFYSEWDGTYAIQFGGSSCGGFEGNPYFNANSYLASYLNTYSTIDVSGNTVQGFTNGGYIDETARAVASTTIAEAGTQATISMDLHFSGEETKTVNGVFYLSVYIPGSNIKCSSNISGTRN